MCCYSLVANHCFCCMSTLQTAQLQTVSGAGGSLQESLTASETALQTARDELAQVKTQLAQETVTRTGLAKDAEGLNTNITELTTKNTALEAKVEELSNSGTAAKRSQLLGLKKLKLQIEMTKAQNDQLKEFVKNTHVPQMLDVFAATQTKVTAQYTEIVDAATKDLLTKYRYEVRQRKLIYNKLQELKGSLLCARAHLLELSIGGDTKRHYNDAYLLYAVCATCFKIPCQETSVCFAVSASTTESTASSISLMRMEWEHPSKSCARIQETPKSERNTSSIECFRQKVHSKTCLTTQSRL